MNVIGFPVCDNMLYNIAGHAMYARGPNYIQVVPRVYYNQLIWLRFLGLTSLWTSKLPTVSGKSTIIVVVDRFSKMHRLIPLGE